MSEEPPDPNLRYPWQQAVFDALREYRPDQKHSKRIAANLAISERLRQRPQETLELLALQDAMRAMQIVFAEPEPKTESTQKKETA